MNGRSADTSNKLPPTLSSRRGFTLLEMAFVLVVIGILVGFGAQMLPPLVKQAKLKEDRAFVKQTKTAIIGYALAAGKLPYAATNPNTGTSVNNQARYYLPWATLGVNGQDAYQKTLFYAVDPYLANTTSLAQFRTRLNELIAGTHARSLFCRRTVGSTTTDIPMAFVVISVGENLRPDTPNNDNTDRIITMADNNVFGDPAAIISPTYDDILESADYSYLNGLLSIP